MKRFSKQSEFPFNKKSYINLACFYKIQCESPLRMRSEYILNDIEVIKDFN